MLKNALSDTVNWKTRKWKQLYNKMSSPYLDDIINSSKKNSNQLENCQKFAHKLSWKLGTIWTTWHLVVGQQACEITHKMDSSMWQTPWQSWFLTFITQTISDNIVTWDTRHSVVDWVCCKTQTVLVILKIQTSTSGGVLEVEHSFQSVGCARNRLLFRTSLQSLKSFQRWDTCPEPTELLLTGCSTESIWNPKSKSKMLTPKTTLAMESISSFVHQDEFLAVFLYPLQWFSFWRSGQKAERQVKTRSEDDVEWKLSNGESNAMSGVARSWAKEWRNLFTKFGISGQSGVCRWKKTSRKSNQATGAPRLKFRNRTSTSESTREFSSSKQASKQLVLDNQNQAESDDKKYSDSKSSRKLAPSSPEWKNMEHTNHDNMSKIFQCLHKKLGMFATNATFSTDAHEPNVLIWRMSITSSMKAAIHLGPNFNSNRTSNRTQNSTSEIGISQWSSEQMG